MKILKAISRLVFAISIAAFILTGSTVAAIVSLGTACFNLGILCGERSRK